MDRLASALAGRYVLERELGRGGMATVYLAHAAADPERHVAIKVLDPDLSMALGAERFRREIEIERRLDHPHILGVIESGDADGVLWYAMPFVSGESLRARMDREGALPVEDALRIACEVADALQHAHQHGIVHRDVKPENVLLEDGRALVADFGIARALSAEQSERLTQTGVSLGTPLYMSPEQAFAERDLDGRSDVYSLGCVLFEMLVGQPPFTGPNAQAIAARHHMEEVPSITIVRPTVSDEVEDVVRCALAKSRVDRCATAADFANRLRALVAAGTATDRRTVATRRTPPRTGGRRADDPLRRVSHGWVAGAVAAVALVAVGMWSMVQARQSTAAESGGELGADSRIAVLYLRDSSADGRLGYIADGITEMLIDRLAEAKIRVVSRGGVLPFRGTAMPLDSVAASLAASAEVPAMLVDGTVRERGGRAFVEVRLHDVRRDSLLDRFEVDLPADSAQALGEGAVEQLAGLLQQRFGAEIVLSSARAAAGNDAAWALAKRAENTRKRAADLWESGDTTATERALHVADSLARRAAALAPTWTEPVVLRGRIALHRASAAPANAEPHIARAIRFADAALAIDPRCGDALELRGTARSDRVFLGLVHDTTEARLLVDASVADLTAATQLGPRASAWVRLSDLAYRQHDLIQASQAAQTAYEQDAYLESAPEVLWRLFTTSYDLNSPVDSDRWCSKGRQRFPADPRFVRCRVLVMTMRGATVDQPVLWASLDELARLTPAPDRAWSASFDRILVAAALGRVPGMADSARRVLVAARVDRAIDPRGELRGYEAFARVVIRDHDEAVRLLDGYLHDNPEHREGFMRINAWWWEDLKADPRFVKLVAPGT